MSSFVLFPLSGYFSWESKGGKTLPSPLSCKKSIKSSPSYKPEMTIILDKLSNCNEASEVLEIMSSTPFFSKHLSQRQKLDFILFSRLNFHQSPSLDPKLRKIIKLKIEFSKEEVRNLVLSLKLDLDAELVSSFREKYGLDFFDTPELIEYLGTAYQFGGFIDDLKALEALFEGLSRPHLLMFWECFNGNFLENPKFDDQKGNTPYPSNPSFIHFLIEKGFPLSKFNQFKELNSGELDTSFGTWLQSLAGRGHIELFKKISSQLPPESLRFEGEQYYPQEIEDCFIEDTFTNYTQFQNLQGQKPLIVQNGCRAGIVLGEKADSYPGLSAQKIAAQVYPGSELDTVRVFHNRKHASLSFSDGEHYGYYPASEYQTSFPIENSLAIGSAGSQVLQTLEEDFPRTTPNSLDGAASFSAAQARYNFMNVISYFPCSVVDDSDQRRISERQNEILLTVYAPKEQTQAMKEYVLNVKKECKLQNPDVAYQALQNNCIEFVHKALNAAPDIDGNPRAAIHSSQLLDRLHQANMVSLYNSGEIEIHHNTSFPREGFSHFVDTLPRSVPQNGLTGILGAAYSMTIGYLTLKRSVKAVKKVSRALFDFALNQVNIKLDFRPKL